MDFWLILLVMFIIGTLMLSKTKAERHVLLFMIRTTRGISLMDKIAGISPRAWLFFADLATVISFAGLGGMYVSKHRRMEPIIFVIGCMGLVVYSAKMGNVLASAVFLVLLSILANWKFNKPVFNTPQASFLVTFVIMALIMLQIFQPSTEGDFILPQEVHVLLAMLGGIIGLPAILIGTLVFQGFMILTEKSETPGVSPALPMVKDGELGLGFLGFDIFIPIWYAVTAIIILLVVHEYAHGILARVHNVRVKSSGLLTIGPVPIGAFVEPDEDELKKRPGVENMRISAVGSFANILTAFAFVSILFFIVIPSYGEGLIVMGVINGTPAYGVIEEETIIYEIDDKEVKNRLSVNIEPDQNITLNTSKGIFVIETTEHPDDPGRGYIGILHVEHTKGFITPVMFISIVQLFYWIYFLNFAVGLVNLLPILPFDGGRMFSELMKMFKLSEENITKIVYWVIAIVLLILLINVTPLFERLIELVSELL